MKYKEILKRYLNTGLRYEDGQNNWLNETLSKLPAGLKLLDAGAGEQRNRKFCKHLNYVSQDLCQYEGVGDSTGLQTGDWSFEEIDIVGDIVNIPEADGSFDIVLCTEVFEHIPNPVLAIAEFQRLLKKDGLLIITAPFCSLTHFAPFHYSTGFNRYFYDHHLNEFGFEVKEMTTNGNYFEYMSQEIWRIRSVAEKYSAKVPSFFDKIVMVLILKMLARLSKHDKGSSELLCYGYHVIARKL
jgi:SAM-dependent methyltransferase